MIFLRLMRTLCSTRSCLNTTTCQILTYPLAFAFDNAKRLPAYCPPVFRSTRFFTEVFMSAHNLIGVPITR
jgi:hypothetical protein